MTFEPGISTAEFEQALADARQALEASPQLVRSRCGELGDVLAQIEARRVMLVVDRHALTQSQLSELTSNWQGAQLAATYDGVHPSPQFWEAKEAAEVATREDVDVIVAVGGGSCLDTAKGAALGAGFKGEFEAFLRSRPEHAPPPLKVIAVPTTSGSGSEATHFAALFHGDQKVSFEHEAMRPVGLILDAALHVGMPSRIAAVTGCDALAQSIESYWAATSTEQSRRDARLAQLLVAPQLVRSATTGVQAAREAVMLGAHFAGRAINVTHTTAAHALSYGITARFHVPHGHAVALTLGQVARANAAVTDDDCVDPRGAEFVRARIAEVCGVLGTTPEEIPRAIDALLNALGLPAHLSAVGVKIGMVPELAAAVDPVRLKNNPRSLDSEDLARVLFDAL